MMKETRREHFTFFASFYDALSDLNDADRLACYDAICAFALTGKEPKVEGIASTVFKLIKPILGKSKTRSEVGKEGGKSKANAKQIGSKLEANAKQNGSKTEANAKQSARDKEYGVGVGVGVGKDKDVDVECSVTRTREDDTDDTHDTHTETEPTRIPTHAAIREENANKGYGLSAESIEGFVEYNRDRGWKMNWRDALAKWAAREKERKKKHPAGSFANFPGRQGEEKEKNDDMVAQVIAMQTGGGG